MFVFNRMWKAKLFLTESVFVAAVLLLSVHPAQGQELSKLRDVAKDTVEKQQSDWVLVSELEGEKESRYNWQSGRDGISVLIFVGDSVREAKERMELTNKILSVGPGKERAGFGDEAYSTKDPKGNFARMRFRDANVYIEISAPTMAITEDLARNLLKEIPNK